MKVLLDVAHPAHVHLFKNMIWKLEKEGCDVKITAKDKEYTTKLLDAYKFKYEVLSEFRRGLIDKAIGMLKINWRLLNLAKTFKPDLLIGVHHESIAHVGKLIRKPSIVFTDTEHAKLGNLLTFPFATVICTPSCFKKDLGRKQVRYNGYHELAYLHPNYFKPDPSVLDDLGLSKNGKFIILRVVSWSASHDIGERGFDNETKMQFIKKLENYGRVFITSETELGREFEKYKINAPIHKIHSLLYYATMYIGESPTMTTESAILGTPAICVSSWACSCGNFENLHNNYGLIHCFKDQNNAIKFALELLEDNNLKKKWQRKREKLLNEKIDVTKFMTDFIEKYPESYHEYKKREG